MSGEGAVTKWVSPGGSHMAKTPLWQALAFQWLGETWSVTVANSILDLQDGLAAPSCSCGIHPSNPVKWGMGLQQECSQDVHSWFWIFFERLSWEGTRQWCKSHRSKCSASCLRNKTEGHHIQDCVSPAAEAITLIAKSSQIFQQGNTSYSFAVDFFLPIFPKMDSSYTKLPHVQGHQETNQLFCYALQKIDTDYPR